MEEFESGHPGWRAATASRPSGNLPSPADAQRIHTHKKKKRDKQRDSAHNTPQEQREHKHKKKKRDRHQGDTENRDSVGSGSRPISPTTYKLQLQSSFRPTWAVGTPIPVTEKGLHQSGSRAPHHATPQQRPAPASSPFTPFDMLASSPAMEQASPAPPGQKKRKKRKSSDVEAGALDGERKKKKKKHRQSDATDGPMPATIAAEPSSSTGGRGDGDGPSLPQRPIRVTSPLPAGTSRLAASAGQDVFTPRKIHPVAHHPINPSSLPYPTSNPSDMHPTTSKIPSSSNVEAVNPDGKRKKKTKKKHLHTDSVAAPALQAAGGAPGGSTSLQQAVSINPSPITPFEPAPSSSPDVVMRPSVRSVDQQLVDPSLLPGSTSAPSQLIPTTSTLPPISDAEAGNTDGKKKKKKKKKHRHFDTAAGPVLEPAAAQASSPAAPLDGDDTAPSPQQPVRNTPPPAADPVPSTSSSSPRMSTRSSMRPVDDHWSPRLIDPALLPEPEANPSDIISTTSPASAGPSASKGTAAAKKIGRPTKRLDEASLRSTIRTKEDAQRYLATTWLTWSELKTFESLQRQCCRDYLGHIADSGSFGRGERQIRPGGRTHRPGVRQGLSTGWSASFLHELKLIGLQRQVLSDDELAEHIHAMKAQTYGNFWSDLAALLPGRPLRGIHPWIKRLYDPRAGQGKWTAAEDAALHSYVIVQSVGRLLISSRAHERTPGDWKAIAQAVGRPELSCRDRFRDRVSIAETRKDAREWTQEDLDKLWECVETIKDEAASSGSAGIPWTIVMERMGGIASRETLRTKWYASLAKHGPS